MVSASLRVESSRGQPWRWTSALTPLRLGDVSRQCLSSCTDFSYSCVPFGCPPSSSPAIRTIFLGVSFCGATARSGTQDNNRQEAQENKRNSWSVIGPARGDLLGRRRWGFQVAGESQSPMLAERGRGRNRPSAPSADRPSTPIPPHLGLLSGRLPDRVEVVAGGGVRGPVGVRRLRTCGVCAVLVASALHDGRLTRTDLAEFAPL